MALQTREDWLKAAQEITEAVYAGFREPMQRAAERGDMRRLSALDREYKEMRKRALAPVVDALNYLPPEPIIIPKPEEGSVAYRLLRDTPK